MGSVEHGSLAASLAALLYLGTLRNGFAFDDHPAIERNPCVQASDHCGWSDLLHTDFWGTLLSSDRSHRSYRPLAVVTLRLNALLATDGGAAGYHALNMLLHAVNTWLVWLHAARTFGGARSAALAAALIFASHPVNSEAVAYCVGRADLLSATFGLLGLRAYAIAQGVVCSSLGAEGPADGGSARSWTNGRAIRSWLSSTVCFSVALACKETALVLLPACLITDVILVVAWQPSPSPAHSVDYGEDPTPSLPPASSPTPLSRRLPAEPRLRRARRSSHATCGRRAVQIRAFLAGRRARCCRGRGRGGWKVIE